ncbi:polysaccharide pyruvyl transferase family protein [Gordonia McavH-238-E]|uniref:polysaccharide pyruvyl transferase family protein n=1 Tax=unclassified Gordonia (in: high G+C Gram-positive bacteria) TaxID=2657482 RepID=UPI001EF6F4C8|nr:polysaccharide pyruvyl transferase family protein [Gordonia sp. McavH-238-E]MCG7631095.1 polysaccharide pyruvyl transferase family protein [Gordonia sp. McavH-238-E]
MTRRPATARPLFRTAGILADRIGTAVRHRTADSRLAREMGADEVIYLVAPAGHPNYGDELIARTWLRHLARVRPNATVVLDCHSPGTATTLLRDAHPDLLVVDTLWQMTTYAAEAESQSPWSWVASAVIDAGLAPRLTAGIDLLHSATSIHLLGGGYLNTVWPHHVSLFVAAAAVARSSGARLAATGQGLVPTLQGRAWAALTEAFAAFDIVDVRDTASYDEIADIGGARHSGDDAWLALHRPRPRPPLYRETDPPAEHGVVLCLQSDLTERFAGPRSTGVEALADFVRTTLDAWDVPGSAVTVVEGIPGHDNEVPFLLGSRLDGATILNFRDVWLGGLPAGHRSTWISTRFHPHLMAAAAGDPGVAVVAMPGYYSTKHRSLIDAGSDWTVVDSGTTVPDRPNGHGFDAIARDRAVSAKLATAVDIYPVPPVLAHRI